MQNFMVVCLRNVLPCYLEVLPENHLNSLPSHLTCQLVTRDRLFAWLPLTWWLGSADEFSRESML